MSENPNNLQEPSVDQSQVRTESMEVNKKMIDEASVKFDLFLIDLNSLEHNPNRIVLINAICSFFEVILDHLEESSYTIVDVIDSETRMAQITELILITGKYDLLIKMGRTIYSSLKETPQTKVLNLLISLTSTLFKLTPDSDSLDNNFKSGLNELYTEFADLMDTQLLPQINSSAYDSQFGVQLRRAIYFSSQLLDWLKKS